MKKNWFIVACTFVTIVSFSSCGKEDESSINPIDNYSGLSIQRIDPQNPEVGEMLQITLTKPIQEKFKYRIDFPGRSEKISVEGMEYVTDKIVIEQLPEGIVNGKLNIFLNDTLSLEADLLLKPKITDVQPEFITAGDTVYIKGHNLVTTSEENQVLFSPQFYFGQEQVSAQLIYLTDTLIKAVVPLGVTGSFQVYSGSITSNEYKKLQLLSPYFYNVTPSHETFPGTIVKVKGYNINSLDVYLDSTPLSSSGGSGIGDTYTERRYRIPYDFPAGKYKLSGSSEYFPNSPAYGPELEVVEWPVLSLNTNEGSTGSKLKVTGYDFTKPYEVNVAFVYYGAFSTTWVDAENLQVTNADLNFTIPEIPADSATLIVYLNKGELIIGQIYLK